jgi:aspartyl-tRNA(Asn)/glutamyl-tRNA(Gln) amidotransferase subunit A
VSTDPAFATLAEAGDALARRTISSVELTRAMLDRIARLEPQLHCFVALDEEGALAAAARADAEIAAGRSRGRLHGVPLAQKDVFDREGRVTTIGATTERAPATTTATVLRRLDAAGAVPIGTLNLDPWIASATGENARFGRCCNPWDLDRLAGGSSSGAAAAVAARMIHGALGGDAGGSIRLPAAWCGVTGLKPTYGRVSRHGAAARAPSLDCIGPLARSALDCALLLQAIAGADVADATAATESVPDYAHELESPLRPRRIGLAVGDAFADVEPDVAARIEDACAVFRSLGVTVVDIRIPDLALITELHQVVVRFESAAILDEALRAHPASFTASPRAAIADGRRIAQERYREALALKASLLGRHVASVFSVVDAVLAPVAPGAAPTLAEIDADDATAHAQRHARDAQFTRFANFLGTPAAAVPCGFTRAGLPVAFQLLGRPFGEGELLAIAHAYQRQTRWHLAAPALAVAG